MIRRKYKVVFYPSYNLKDPNGPNQVREEIIEADSFTQNEHLVAFGNHSDVVSKQGQPSVLIHTLFHWDDVREVRLIENSLTLVDGREGHAS